MTIYARARAAADRMLQAFGEAATIRRTTVVAPDPSVAELNTATSQDYACRVAVFPVDQRDIDGTTIKAGDYRVILSAQGLTIVPTTTDRLVCSAGELVIVDAGRFAPAGEVTHYRMICRK